MWGWAMLIGYLSVLLLAALWAVVERLRWAIVAGRPGGSDVQPGRLESLALDGAAADSMTTRERNAEREAAQRLVRST